MQTRVAFEFGEFLLDPTEHLLIRNGESVRLQAKAFDTLVALVQNRGRLMTKEELLRVVWPDSFVEENNLTKNVAVLRRVFTGSSDTFIETVPRLGYRFKAEVRVISLEMEARIERLTRINYSVEEEITEIESSLLTRRQKYFLVAAILLVGIAAAFWIEFPSRSANRQTVAAAGATGNPVKYRWTSNREAAEAYSRARELWKTRSSQDLYQATRLLESAVQADPEFVLAHSALADAYAFDYYDWPKAVDEAKKAIEIEPGAGEPHASIGFVKMFWESDLRAAESEFETAVKLSPAYSTGHQWYALDLVALGRRDAALVEIEKAEQLEPGSTAIMADHCQILYYAERYEDALGQCSRLLDLDAQSVRGHELLFQIYSTTGRFDDSIREFMAAQSHIKSDRIQILAQQARNAYHEKGIEAFHNAMIKFYTASDMSYKLARELAQSGNRDAAIAQLIKAADTHDLDLVFFNADPAFSTLSGHPAIQVLLAKLIH